MNRYTWPAIAAVLSAAAAMLALPVDAATRRALTVEQAWARATPPGVEVGAVYLVIRNPGRHSDRLLAASTPRAARVEFHTTIRDVDVVRMQRVEPVHVPAAATLTLEPGGMHAMLFGVRSALREGERFPLSLTFERAGRQLIDVRVVAAGATPAGHAHH